MVNIFLTGLLRHYSHNSPVKVAKVAFSCSRAAITSQFHTLSPISCSSPGPWPRGFCLWMCLFWTPHVSGVLPHVFQAHRCDSTHQGFSPFGDHVVCHRGGGLQCIYVPCGHSFPTSGCRDPSAAGDGCLVIFILICDFFYGSP